MYISAAANADIVFVNGSTYIWAIGPDGQRHRHFYGHGDRRHEVFARRDNLRSVNAHRSGHPPANHAAYASHDAQHHREEAHRHDLAHRSEPHNVAQQPRDHVAAKTARIANAANAANTANTTNATNATNATNTQPHPADPHHHVDPKQNHSVREVSVDHNGPRHHPEPGV